MFETVSKASPGDYQSLEILKEAYWKIGRLEEALSVSRRLADAYMHLGQYSSALLEYEGILQQVSDSPEVQAVVDELEAKLHQSKGASTGKGAAIALDFGVDESLIVPGEAEGEFKEGASGFQTWTPAMTAGMSLETTAGAAAGAVSEPSLIATQATRIPRNLDRKIANISLDHDGNEPLAKFLIQHRLATHQIVNNALERVRQRNETPAVKEGTAPAGSLLNEIGKAGGDIEALLSGIIDRTKFAYAPLENYDVDRQIVKMLPEHLTLGRGVVPFDVVSRTMMVAVDNPFDLGAKAAVQQAVDYHIQWHLALPHVLRKILRDVYRLSE